MHNCVGLHVGTTIIKSKDLARATNMPHQACKESIEKGRQKIAAWLKLIAQAENVQHNKAACASCGKVGCKGGKDCNERTRSIAELAKEIPLDQAVDMSPPRWQALLANGALRAFYKEMKHED